MINYLERFFMKTQYTLIGCIFLLLSGTSVQAACIGDPNPLPADQPSSVELPDCRYDTTNVLVSDFSMKHSSTVLGVFWAMVKQTYEIKTNRKPNEEHL